MIAFIDDHRGAYGVEPICKVLPIAPSTYHAHVAKRADPSRLSARARRDDDLMPEVRRVFEENFGVYGVRKVWRQLKREGHDVARCTVARLMRAVGLQGVIRGKPVRTTISDKATPCPLDHVNRQFQAAHPNALWLSDFTYVATWAGSSTSPSSSMHTLGASSAGARHERRTRASCSTPWNRLCMTGGPSIAVGSCITAIEAVSTSIKYTERLADAGIEPSVGSVGDSYDCKYAAAARGV
jgi:transposase InsO family protein